MRYRSGLLLIFIVTILFSCKAEEDRAEEILSKLSLMEKLSILTGPGNYQALNLKAPVSGVAGYINGVKNDELDIPAFKLADGPAGLRISPPNYTTAWPVGTLLASTWDVDLIEEVGRAKGHEVKEYGVDFILAPGMNIQRNPLAGRNFEYYSEDPLLTGKLSAAMVRGIQSNGVGATLKHFFGNESETNRNYLNVKADPRTLREIYLRGFQIAVEESNPWAIMSSYNLVNGLYVNQNPDYLTHILRDDWNFSGFVMSDWYAGNVFADPDSAAKQVKAGNDLIMPGLVLQQLYDSFNRGFLTEDEIDRSVSRILKQVIKTPSYSGYEFSNSPDLDKNAKLARKAGTEGMILLKNDNNILPIPEKSSIGLFGIAQYLTYKGGMGSGNVSSEYIIDITTGLSKQFQVNDDLKDYYREFYFNNRTSHPDPFAGIPIYSAPELSYKNDKKVQELLRNSSEKDNSAVITISRQAGEGVDRESIRGSYLLTEKELDMIKMVSEYFHKQNKPVIVVLNVDGVIDTTEWASYVDGIFLAYMGGQETGHQIADLLSGNVNPSGKLSQTIPLNYSDVPSANTFPGTDINGDGKPDYIENHEGIYVGYRYYISSNTEVAYPFGFGLSYTDFDIDNRRLVSNRLSEGRDGNLELMASVKNSGERSGKEVLQVYISSPEVVLDKPNIELKSFGKTELLESGESDVLRFSIPARDLASFDPDRNLWIIEKGEYKVYISNSSDISNSKPLLFSIEEEIIVNKTSPLL